MKKKTYLVVAFLFTTAFLNAQITISFLPKIYEKAKTYPDTVTVEDLFSNMQCDSFCIAKLTKGIFLVKKIEQRDSVVPYRIEIKDQATGLPDYHTVTVNIYSDKDGREVGSFQQSYFYHGKMKPYDFYDAPPSWKRGDIGDYKTFTEVIEKFKLPWNGSDI